MFTWICPTCGREVPPAYDECPDCAAKNKPASEANAANVAPPPPAGPAPPGPPPAYTPPPAPAPPQYAPPAQYAPPPAGPRFPTWLLAVLFALLLVCLGGAVIWFVHRSSAPQQASAAAPVPPPSAATLAKESELQKYIEVAGIRFTETPKQTTDARFLVINHSGADISDLSGTVNIWGRAGKTEEAAGSFSFHLPSLGPYESKEVTAPVTTKLRVYELPDWQFITTQVQITSP